MGLRETYRRERERVASERRGHREELRRDPAKRAAYARRLAYVCLGALVLLGGLVVVGSQREAPLRGDGLAAAQAEVVDHDRRRWVADRIEVRFDADGTQQQARIPVSERFAVGDVVEVLYDPADPSHVRTTRGWAPWYSSAHAVLALGVAGLGLAVAVVQVLLARRQQVTAG